jgi:hypothetical protein
MQDRIWEPQRWKAHGSTTSLVCLSKLQTTSDLLQTPNADLGDFQGYCSEFGSIQIWMQAHTQGFDLAAGRTKRGFWE